MTVSVLTGDGANDDRPVHDATILLGIIKQLCQLIDSSTPCLSDVESWLHRLCSEQVIGKSWHVILLASVQCHAIHRHNVDYWYCNHRH